MARKIQPTDSISPIERLSKIVPRYYSQKSEMDAIKKVVDKENAEIKSLMKESSLTEFEIDDIRATYSISERQDFMEEALIEKIKALKVKGIIKKKEYVDMDALENAIYHEKIDAAELAPCKTVKEVVTLRVTKIKE